MTGEVTRWVPTPRCPAGQVTALNWLDTSGEQFLDASPKSAGKPLPPYALGA